MTAAPVGSQQSQKLTILILDIMLPHSPSHGLRAFFFQNHKKLCKSSCVFPDDFGANRYLCEMHAKIFRITQWVHTVAYIDVLCEICGLRLAVCRHPPLPFSKYSSHPYFISILFPFLYSLYLPFFYIKRNIDKQQKYF